MVMNYNYGRTMELPNLPWWSAATFVPPILPSAYTPSWGMGTFPATAPIVWAVPPFPFVPPAFGPLSYVPVREEVAASPPTRAAEGPRRMRR